MIFERTKKDMAILEIRDQVTVYDAFRLFRDLCEDIKDDGELTLEQLPQEDIDSGILGFLWAGQTFLKVGKRNQELIKDPGRAGKFLQLYRELGEIEQQMSKSQTDISDLEKALEEKYTLKKKLDEIHKQMRQVSEEKEELKKNIAIQEKELRILENWGKSLQARQYKEKLVSCQNRLKVLLGAKRALEKELSQGLLYSQPAALKDYQKFYKDELDEIAGRLERYQKCYDLVTNSFFDDQEDSEKEE